MKRRMDDELRPEESEQLFGETSLAFGNFAGRRPQQALMKRTLANPEAHLLIFGEPSVGKTCLAGTAGRPSGESDARKTESNARVVPVGETFSETWEALTRNPDGTRDASLAEDPDADAVAAYAAVRRDRVFCVDDFQRASASTAGEFARLMGILRERHIGCSLVLVGRAGRAEELFPAYDEFRDTITPINLPRMNADELREIITNALSSLEVPVKFNEAAVKAIIYWSRGFPGCVQMLGTYATWAAAQRGSRWIQRVDAFTGLFAAIRNWGRGDYPFAAEVVMPFITENAVARGLIEVVMPLIMENAVAGGLISDVDDPALSRCMEYAKYVEPLS